MIRKSMRISFIFVLVVYLMSLVAYAKTPQFDGNGIVLKVMCSGGFYSTLEELAPIYEQNTGNKIVLIAGASMGAAPTAIPTRLKNGEEADIIIMAESELNKLIEDGLVFPESHINLVRSKIGMVVRAGEPKPDISTKDALVNILLEAKSIGYSASASGSYLSKVLFPQLGINEQIKDKSKMVVNERVAVLVARGELEIGFQQVSELLSIPGVDFVGTLPDDIQKITVFSSGIAVQSKQAAEGEKFVQFLLSPEGSSIIIKQGLEPFQ